MEQIYTNMIKDCFSLIKNKPLTEEQKQKIMFLNKTLSDNIKDLDSDFSKIIDENFWELI